MDTRRACAETLREAAAAAGSPEALAARLKIPAHRLRRWMAGYGVPPLEVFLASLDIVAAGPALLGLTRSVMLPGADESAAGRTSPRSHSALKSPYL